MSQETHQFTLILPGLTELTDEMCDALYEAGCDDAWSALCWSCIS